MQFRSWSGSASDLREEMADGEILGEGETTGEIARVATASAHWDCLRETVGAGAAGSGAELEVGAATQQGAPQAQREQQGRLFAIAALPGRTLCVSTSNTLNKMAKVALT